MLRRFSFLFFIIVASGLSLGCSGTQLLNMFSKSSSACKVNNIPFYTSENLHADVYYSYDHSLCQSDQHNVKENNNLAKGTVVFIYGGSWKTGNKTDYAFIADSLNKQGYDVIIPNYRLYPEVAYPAFLEDVARFFNWLKQHEDEYNMNTQQLFLMGHSAGSFNAAMYLVDDRYPKPYTFTGFIGLAGPYDFFLPTQDPEYVPIFTRNNPNYNSPSQLPVNQMPEALHNTVRHALVLHGQQDTVVTPKNVESFTEFLQAHGVNAKGKVYEDIDHAKIVGGINNVPFFNSQVEKDIIEFLNSATQQDRSALVTPQ